jgi:hypothetical protein
MSIVLTPHRRPGQGSPALRTSAESYLEQLASDARGRVTAERQRDAHGRVQAYQPGALSLPSRYIAHRTRGCSADPLGLSAATASRSPAVARSGVPAMTHRQFWIFGRSAGSCEAQSAWLTLGVLSCLASTPHAYSASEHATRPFYRQHVESLPRSARCLDLDRPRASDGRDGRRDALATDGRRPA